MSIQKQREFSCIYCVIITFLICVSYRTAEHSDDSGCIWCRLRQNFDRKVLAKMIWSLDNEHFIEMISIHSNLMDWWLPDAPQMGNFNKRFMLAFRRTVGTANGIDVAADWSIVSHWIFLSLLVFHWIPIFVLFFFLFVWAISIESHHTLTRVWGLARIFRALSQ